MAKKLTSKKAKEILHDKSVHGHPLTDKQRKFFGAIAGGAKPYKNGGWLDKYPEAQNGTYTSPDEQKAWLQSYVNSPMYKTRLQREFGTQDVDNEWQQRINNINTSTYAIAKQPLAKDWGYVSGLYIPKEYKGQYYDYSKNKWVNNSYTKDPEKHFDKKGKVYLEPEYRKGYTPFSGFETTPLHEFSHTIDDGGFRIPKSTEQYIYNNTIGDSYPSHKSGNMSFAYKNTPTEFIGRIQPIRYLLNKQGIYDTRKQEFNSNFFDKMMKNKTIQNNVHFQDVWDQLKGNDKQKKAKFIEMMNRIAANSPEQEYPVAQNGIEGTMGGLTDQGFNYNGAWGGTMQMGGSLPGSTGMMYARTQSPAPSNGKYAKKTKASAQNGREMQFYQEGLDFTPKTISKDGGWLSKYDDGGIIEDDRGQWDHPGEITKINSNQITMQGVDYPVLGISDTGDTQMMQPGQDYSFDGNSVTEIPLAQNGIKSKSVQKTGLVKFFEKGFEVGDDIKEGFQNIVEAITPEVNKEWLFKKYRPVDYPSIGTAISNLVMHSDEPIGRDAQGDLNVGEEAWSKALGRPTKEKYIVPSKYKPTTAKDSNAQYYALNNIIDQDKLIAEARKRGLEPGAKYQIEGLGPYIKKGVMDEDYFGMIDPLQNFQINVDPEGKYISLYDKYDFNSGLLNAQIKPFEFYDRFYLPKTKSTIKKENGGWLNKYE